MSHYSLHQMSNFFCLRKIIPAGPQELTLFPFAGATWWLKDHSTYESLLSHTYEKKFFCKKNCLFCFLFPSLFKGYTEFQVDELFFSFLLLQAQIFIRGTAWRADNYLLQPKYCTHTHRLSHTVHIFPPTFFFCGNLMGLEASNGRKGPSAGWAPWQWQNTSP